MDYITLSNATQLHVPSTARVLGVVGDSAVRGLQFELKRFPTPYFDLGKAEIFITYEDSENQARAKDLIEVVMVTDQSVRFDWKPKNPLFANAGQIRIKVNAIIKKDMEVVQQWNTEPCFFKVVNTLPDYELSADQEEEGIYFLSKSDYATQEEVNELVDRVYKNALEGATNE
jgi:hypothetical protein